MELQFDNHVELILKN